jgi:hypothetical protein
MSPIPDLSKGESYKLSSRFARAVKFYPPHTLLFIPPPFHPFPPLPTHTYTLYTRAHIDVYFLNCMREII